MTSSGKETMQATLRECRMVVERLCQSIGVPDGILASVTNCGVYSAALGLSGFPGIERQLGLLADIDAERMSAIVESESLRFSAAGQHAWVAAEPALDLLVAHFRVDGVRKLIIEGAKEPLELEVIGALAEKHHLDAQIEISDEGVATISVSDREANAQTVLDGIVRDGIEVERNLWFGLFHRSHDALAPDTVLSRTHTGSIIVKPDGTVIGTEDPEFVDTDLSMLTKDTLIKLEKAGTTAND
jgi:hypothetical protein